MADKKIIEVTRKPQPVKPTIYFSRKPDPVKPIIEFSKKPDLPPQRVPLSSVAMNNKSIFYGGKANR